MVSTYRSNSIHPDWFLGGFFFPNFNSLMAHTLLFFQTNINFLFDSIIVSAEAFTGRNTIKLTYQTEKYASISVIPKSPNKKWTFQRRAFTNEDGSNRIQFFQFYTNPTTTKLSSLITIIISSPIYSKGKIENWEHKKNKRSCFVSFLNVVLA
jgi:hypothetical protein